MKKLLAASVAGILVCASVFAQKVSLTNTFGANDDNTGNGDFLEFNRKVSVVCAGIMKLLLAES